MVNQYCILVDKRDVEKLRIFQIGKFNMQIKKILDDHGYKFIWGFHKSQISDSWKKIRKNDRVFFSIPKNNFEITSLVAKKLFDKKIGKRLWPDNLDSQEITHFLLFDSIQHVNLSFLQTIENASDEIKILFPGIYELKKSFKINIDKSDLQNKHKSIPKPFIVPSTKVGPAQKDIFEVIRFIRDSTKVKKLKKLYNNKCQICNYTFEYKKNHFYSEVHHYNPLKANADDELDNMIVVCPNHHAEFDYNMIAIAHDGTSIIDKKGNKIATIYFKDGHRLNIKNITNQLREI